MFSTGFKGVGLHYTAFGSAIREDLWQTAASRGVTPRKKFAAKANVESRVKGENWESLYKAQARDLPVLPTVDEAITWANELIAQIDAS